MQEVLIFSGTSEGRTLAEILSSHSIPVTVCVATEYGQEVMEAAGDIGKNGDCVKKMQTVTVRVGRLNAAQMEKLIGQQDWLAIVDATHPFAEEVTKNIAKACKNQGREVLRLLREQEDRKPLEQEDRKFLEQEDRKPLEQENRKPLEQENRKFLEQEDRKHLEQEDRKPLEHTDIVLNMDKSKDTNNSENINKLENIKKSKKLENIKSSKKLESSIIYVNSTWEAIQYLNKTAGNIFLTTGSKELPEYVEGIEDRNRIYARILPSPAEVEKCHALGLTGKQLICMQGPFSQEMNTAMMREIHAAILVTKETAKAGGFPEKLAAAEQVGADAVVIRRPVETGYSMKEILEKLGVESSSSFCNEKKAEASEKKELSQFGTNVQFASKENIYSKIKKEHKITLAGIGMGNIGTMTMEVYNACQHADVIIGAKRMLEVISHFQKPMVNLYKSRKITDYILQNPQYENIVIVLSGDVGFYSGAKGLIESFQEAGIIEAKTEVSECEKTEAAEHQKEEAAGCREMERIEPKVGAAEHQKEEAAGCREMGRIEPKVGAAECKTAEEALGWQKTEEAADYWKTDKSEEYKNAHKTEAGIDGRIQYKVQQMCGISSVVYFASKLCIPWEDIALLSAHGRQQNVIGTLDIHKKVFALTSGAEGVRKLSQELLDYGYDEIKMYVGYQLSYEQEKIFTGTPKDFVNFEKEGLAAVLLIHEKAAEKAVTHGMGDEAFIRGKVPMTKEEVRCISLSKLALKRDSVVYDIGAGTGSISIECSKIALQGKIYAIEKKSEALELIRQNKYQHRAWNVEIVAGEAPEGLRELPAPTHAFLGGTSGKLIEILDVLWKKNPHVRVVINAISLETVAEVMQLIRENDFEKTEIVQVSVSKAKALGKHQLMMGQNPVYIITLQKS